MKLFSAWLGFDPRESDAFAVARSSIVRRSDESFSVNGIVLDVMRHKGLYRRPTSQRPHPSDPSKSILWDDISDFSMSTEFAISRFLTPILAREGWALFADSDILARKDITEILREADPRKALMCVHHDYRPEATVKMDGQVQSKYNRKNWSSVMLFNCDHPANRRLTVELINTVPGRDLHRFCWLDDHEIGELSPQWNFLVGHSDPSIDPAIVHFTEGGPWLPQYGDVPFANEWREELHSWAS